MPTKDQFDELMFENQGNESLMNTLGKFKKAIWRSKFFILIYIFLVCITAIIWLNQLPEYYRATSAIVINPEQVLDKSEKKSLQNIDMQASLIRSAAIANNVLDTYHLRSVSPFSDSPDPVGEFFNLLQTRADKRNKLIYIDFVYYNPQVAALVANRIADEFVRSRSEKSGGMTQESILVLQEELKKEVEKLDDIKIQLSDIKKQFPDVDDEEMVRKQISYLNSEILKINAEKIKVKTTTSEIEEFIAKNNIEFIHPYVKSDFDVKDRVLDLRKYEKELFDLTQKYRDQHPDILALKSKIKAVKQSLFDSQRQIIDSLKLEYKSLELREKKLQETIVEIQEENQSITVEKLRYRNLLDEEGTVKRNVQRISDQLNEASVKSSISGSGVQFFSEATPPLYPFKPKRAKMMMATLAFALFSSFWVVFLAVYLDKSLKTDRDIEFYVKERFLGAIPMVRVKKSKGFDLNHLPKPKSDEFRQALNTIRPNTRLLMNDEDQKMVLVTSANKREGKSFVSYHLSKSFSRIGKKVLVLDLDFYNSPEEKSYPVAEGKSSLVDYVNRRLKLNDIIQKIGRNEDFIYVQTKDFNVVDLLRSTKVKTLIKSIKSTYDYVLIDAPPALPYNDILELRTISDICIVVAEWGKTGRDNVKRAVDKIKSDCDIPIGVVLNKTKQLGASTKKDSKKK